MMKLHLSFEDFALYFSFILSVSISSLLVFEFLSGVRIPIGIYIAVPCILTFFWLAGAMLKPLIAREN